MEIFSLSSRYHLITPRAAGWFLPFVVFFFFFQSQIIIDRDHCPGRVGEVMLKCQGRVFFVVRATIWFCKQVRSFLIDVKNQSCLNWWYFTNYLTSMMSYISSINIRPIFLTVYEIRHHFWRKVKFRIFSENHH